MNTTLSPISYQLIPLANSSLHSSSIDFVLRKGSLLRVRVPSLGVSVSEHSTIVFKEKNQISIEIILSLYVILVVRVTCLNIAPWC